MLYDLGVVSTKEPFGRLVSQGMILGEVEYSYCVNAAGQPCSEDAHDAVTVKVSASVCLYVCRGVCLFVELCVQQESMCVCSGEVCASIAALALYLMSHTQHTSLFLRAQCHTHTSHISHIRCQSLTWTRRVTATCSSLTRPSGCTHAHTRYTQGQEMLGFTTARG